MGNKTKRIKPIFIVDLLMAIFGFASAWTGIEIHYAGHFQGHSVWHGWSVVHVLINVAWLIVCIIHCKHHWAWYKSILKGKSSLSRKSKITLSVSLVFTAAALTGINLLLFSEGQGTHEGLHHYIIGLVLSALCLGHFIKRFAILRKGLTKR